METSEKNKRFRCIYEQYSKLIFSVAYSYMKNSADANDVIQEAFLRFYQHMDNLTDEEHIKPWLITVTSNICKNTLRSGWFTRTVSSESCNEAEFIQDFGDDNDLFNAVMKLPENERIPIHLFYYEGCSSAEIARLTNTREGNVRVRLMRGRKRLKKLLKEETL